MENKICAIHQPNFFPWIGYFDKINKCNKFVILDDVQYQKKGGTWSNRVAVNIQGQSKWLTAPINRPSGLWKINDTTFQEGKWREKIIKTLQANYSKAAYFGAYEERIFQLVLYKTNHLTDYNVHAIINLCKLLNIEIDSKIVFASDFNFHTSSNELLIDLTKAVGCDTYMAGGGASEYQDIDMFSENSLDFTYQNFHHPIYQQINTQEFIPGLSIIDYIFNNGCRL
jgi:hypothetical protein